MPRPIIAALTLAVILIVFLSGGCTGGTATIKGNVSEGWDPHQAVSGVLVRASPQDGGATVYNVSDDKGNFTLTLRPGVRYNISGICYDPYGQYSFLDIRYLDDNFSDGVTLAPGETLRIKAHVMRIHPPMGFFMKTNPVNGSSEFAPSTPVSVSGHVYLDGKPVFNAFVEALTPYGATSTPTVTNVSGGYRLDLSSRTQYNITATYQGKRHTIWPVFIGDNGTGICDIYLDDKPGTIMAGTAADDEPWLRQPGAVTIEATPVDRSAPINATIGPDNNFTLDMKPFTYYDISGKYQSPDGNYHDLTFNYRNGITFSEFMLRPDETALVYYFTQETFV